MATPHLCLDEGVALPDEENFQGTEPEGSPKPKEIEKKEQMTLMTRRRMGW